MTKFKAGKRYFTRDGREAVIYSTKAQQPYVIHGSFINNEGFAHGLMSWAYDGKSIANGNGKGGSDLIQNPAKKKKRKDPLRFRKNKNGVCPKFKKLGKYKQVQIFLRGGRRVLTSNPKDCRWAFDNSTSGMSDIVLWRYVK